MARSCDVDGSNRNGQIGYSEVNAMTAFEEPPEGENLEGVWPQLPGTSRDTRALARNLLGVEGIMLLTRPHDSTDVTIVCRPALHRNRKAIHCEDRTEKPVLFYCHAGVLRRTCGLVAARSRFEAFSGVERRRPMTVDIPMNEDVVFEVLRYIYCGSIFVPCGFKTWLRELIHVVDFLAVEQGPENEVSPGIPGILREFAIVSLLSRLTFEDLRLLLRDIPFGMRACVLQHVTHLRAKNAEDAPPAQLLTLPIGEFLQGHKCVRSEPSSRSLSLSSVRSCASDRPFRAAIDL
eukprot:TRINITY_DN70820_c0_g1_i1.p1 TRINITY_DN70820_c0_g1~~TRINITY_DN70820_c0_g1_i1.p1  ORF type:complete len:299 (-),score=26.89 TRINITY_DN70820_c0_g1_i1:47-922(-)